MTSKKGSGKGGKEATHRVTAHQQALLEVVRVDKPTETAPVLGPIETQLQTSRAEIGSYKGDRVIGIDAGAYQTKVFDSRENVVVVRNLVGHLLPGRGIRARVESEGGRVFEDGERHLVLGDDVVKFLRYVEAGSVRSPVKEPGKLDADLGVYEKVIPFALSFLGTPLEYDERV